MKKNLVLLSLLAGSTILVGCNSGSGGGGSSVQEALPAGTYNVTFTNQNPANCGTDSYDTQLISNGAGNISSLDGQNSNPLNLNANPCLNFNFTDPIFGITLQQKWSTCSLESGVLTAAFYNSVTGSSFDSTCNATITLTPASVQ